MSKIRDEMAERFTNEIPLEDSNEYEAHLFRVNQRHAFKAGWQSALQNAPEVTALVEALEDILKIDTDQTEIFPCGMIAKDALTQWKESTTKKREE